MVEIYNNFYFLPLFLLLSTLSLFNIGIIFGGEEDFFGIFPEDYYDPRDYGQDSDTPDQINEDETINLEKPIKDGLGKSTNSLSENESDNLNFIVCGRLEV